VLLVSVPNQNPPRDLVGYLIYFLNIGILFLLDILINDGLGQAPGRPVQYYNNATELTDGLCVFPCFAVPYSTV
jgi:hypothetical protein